jgi:hypothetical protein
VVLDQCALRKADMGESDVLWKGGDERKRGFQEMMSDCLTPQLAEQTTPTPTMTRKEQKMRIR